MAVVGTLVVTLTARTSRFTRALDKAQRRLDRFSRRVQRLGRRLLFLGGVPLFFATKAAMDFEHQMSKVATMVDEASMSSMPRLTAAVKRLAEEYGQSTETLADGLYDILSAQVAVSQSLPLLEEGARAAIGGFTDTKTSVSAIITILNAYGDELRDAADASDFLFSVVKRGRLTYEELAENIGTVAPMAAAVGVSVEEFGAALALITRGMPNVDRATTALANVIETFLKNTTEAKEAAAALGIEMSSAGIRADGLLYVLRQLAKVDPDTVAKVFPRRRALRGLIIAVQKVEELGVDIETMTNRAGAAQRAYEKVSDNAWQAVKRLWQTVVGAGRSIGKDFLAPIVAAADATRTWIQRNQEVVKVIGKLLLAVTGLGAALLVVAGAAKVAAIAMSPLGLGLVAVAGIAMVLDALGVLNLGFSDFVNNVRLGGARIATWFSAIGRGIADGWDEAMTQNADAFDRFNVGLANGLDRIRRGWSSLMAYLVEKFAGVVDSLIAGLNVFIEALNKLPKVEIELIQTTAGDIAENFRAAAEEYDAEIDKRNRAFLGRNAQRYEELAQRSARRMAESVSAFSEDFASAMTEADPLAGQLDNYQGLIDDLDMAAGAGALGGGRLERPAALERGTVGAYSAGVATPHYRGVESVLAESLKEERASGKTLQSIDQSIHDLLSAQPAVVGI